MTKAEKKYVSVPKEPTVQMYIDGGHMLKICASEGNLYSKSAYRVYKSMLAAAPAEQRTAAQQTPHHSKAGGVMTTLTDETIDSAEKRFVRHGNSLAKSTFRQVFAQAKRTNALEAECERLREERDCAANNCERESLLKIQAQSAKESAERRLAVAVGALETMLNNCPHCGGNGQVETGAIQHGVPFWRDCGYCSAARKVFNQEVK